MNQTGKSILLNMLPAALALFINGLGVSESGRVHNFDDGWKIK